MDKIDLRELLNNFFQDVDTEAKIDDELANAIIATHLSIFEKEIKDLLKTKEMRMERKWKRKVKDGMKTVIKAWEQEKSWTR